MRSLLWYLNRSNCLFSIALLSRWSSSGLTAIQFTSSFRHVILPRSRRNQRRIYRFEFKSRLIRIRREVRFRGLEEVLIITLGEVRFVVRPARFIPQARPLSHHT